MDFTREPIIETIITPRDGCKIVVRSSKTLGQEEYFVDAVEVISFGGTTFFRSQERPKAFLVPASDYEVLEVREARVVLKNVGLDRSIKIAGGKDPHKNSNKDEKSSKDNDRRHDSRHESKDDRSEKTRDERSNDKHDKSRDEKEKQDLETSQKDSQDSKAVDAKNDPKGDARSGRRDRRRGRGRRRGSADDIAGSEGQENNVERKDDESSIRPNSDKVENEKVPNTLLSSLLTPPPTLISETLHRYRDNALFQSAFYTKEELETLEAQPQIILPEIASYEQSELAEEKIDKESFSESLFPEPTFQEADFSDANLGQAPEVIVTPVDEPDFTFEEKPEEKVETSLVKEESNQQITPS